MNRTRNWREQVERWHWPVASLGTALLALRVSLEATPQRPVWGLTAALLCVVAGYAVHRWASGISLVPLWSAWLYAVWPLPSPRLSLGLVFVALIATLVHNLRWSRQWTSHVDWLVDGLVFLGALALYVATLAPTVLPADSGEFQIVGPLLGVAHPPGYALFTLIAKLFSLLPFGEVPWRVNLMGAVTGALTLVVVSRTARRLTASRWAGIAAAGALGVSTTFWAQSTTINIRAFIALFTALCLHSLTDYLLAPADSKDATSAMTRLAASFGLLIAHHYPQAALLPAFGVVVLWHDPGILKRVRSWPRHLTAFLLPFLSDLYIVVRAITGAPFGTDELVDAGRIVDHLLGRGFSGDMFAFLRLDRVLWERFLVTGNILHFQFGGPLLALSAVGLVWLVWKRRKLAFLLGGVFAVMVFVVATYRAPQSVEYLMPAYIPLALCIGCAVALATQLSGRLNIHCPSPAMPSSFTSLLTATLLLPIFGLGCLHLPSYAQLHRDRSAREYAESVLLDAPPNAHILANWHWYTPLRYLQLVEGRRADVQVTYVYPQGATAMPQAWPQHIERELERSGRPLIVTSSYPTYGDLPYRFAPQGEAFRVDAGPSRKPPANLSRLDTDFMDRHRDTIRVLGYRIYGQEELHPGDRVVVDLAWQPLVRLERSYSFYVHLVGADDVPLGQRDRRHDAAPTYEPGEVLVDRYEFPVFLHAAPGTYRLIAGVYLTFDDGSWQRLTARNGSDAVTLSTVSVAPSSLSPVTIHPLYRPFVGGPTLVGVDYDDTFPETRRVYMHWRVWDRSAMARLYVGSQAIAQGAVPSDAREGYVTTVLDVPPGTEDLRLALAPADPSATLPGKGAWGIASPASVPLPRPRSHQHYLPFGGKIALIGASVQETWAAGACERVSVRFLGLRPIVRDYVVSVGARGERVFDLPSDGVPAIGAIPTFKWIRGSRVADVHLIQVFPEASGEAELTLGIYDAFTTSSLPPLDERIARQGRVGVPLRRISVP